MKFVRFAVTAMLGYAVATVHALTFTPGHYYGTHWYGSQSRVLEYAADGTFLSSLNLGDFEAQGLSFGHDGLLYVVSRDAVGNGAITSYRADGAVVKTYDLASPSIGKISFAEGGDAFYVNTYAGIYRFHAGTGASELVLGAMAAHGVDDFALLPDGGFLTAGQTTINRLDRDGKLISQFSNLSDPYGLTKANGPFLYNIRALEYDPVLDRTYVAASGYSDFYNRVFALQGTSNTVLGMGAVAGANDIALDGSGHVLVGSFSSFGAILSASDMKPSSSTLYVGYVTALTVPEPSALLLSSVGALFLLGYIKRRHSSRG